MECQAQGRARRLSPGSARKSAQPANHGHCATVSDVSLQRGPNFLSYSTSSPACLAFAGAADSLSLWKGPASGSVLSWLLWPLLSIPRPQQVNQVRLSQWSTVQLSNSYSACKAHLQCPLLGGFPVPQYWVTHTPTLHPPPSPDHILQERPRGYVCRSSSPEAEPRAHAVQGVK